MNLFKRNKHWWNLDYYIAKKALPEIKNLKENKFGYPADYLLVALPVIASIALIYIGISDIINPEYGAMKDIVYSLNQLK